MSGKFAKAQSLHATNGWLRPPYQDSNNEHADATDNNLECCPQKWRIHVAFADPANHQKFDRNEKHRESCGGTETERLNQPHGFARDKPFHILVANERDVIAKAALKLVN